MGNEAREWYCLCLFSYNVLLPLDSTHLRSTISAFAYRSLMGLSTACVVGLSMTASERGLPIPRQNRALLASNQDEAIVSLTFSRYTRISAVWGRHHPWRIRARGGSSRCTQYLLNHVQFGVR